MSVVQHELMHRVRRIHFIGVGGAGMSGIAEVLSNLGYSVSGSDTSSSRVLDHLSQVGVAVMRHHAEKHVEDADVVVVSSAIGADNVELRAARAHRIPVVPRAEMLAELMRFRQGVAIAGTHGKTTTTSLVSAVLAEAGLDPTFVVGGLVKSINAHARLGTGRYLVAEADESDASFLLLQPVMAVLTNVDADHMETYEGDFSVLKDNFAAFLRRLPFYGVALICVDDEHAAALADEVRARVIKYGFSDQADVRGFALGHENGRERFRVECAAAGLKAEFELNLSGEHNVLNALAAVAVAIELGVSEECIGRALARFEGIARRCQVHPEICLGEARVCVVDDYGHHPRELDAVLRTISRRWPDQRVVVVFQPHRYTRTRDLLDDFAEVLARVDVLLLLEVYAAGENPIAGADSRALARAVRTRGTVEPVLVSHLEQVRSVLERIVVDDDVVAMLGAGNIGQLAEEFVTAGGVAA